MPAKKNVCKNCTSKCFKNELLKCEYCNFDMCKNCIYIHCNLFHKYNCLFCKNEYINEYRDDTKCLKCCLCDICKIHNKEINKNVCFKCFEIANKYNMMNNDINNKFKLLDIIEDEKTNMKDISYKNILEKITKLYD